MKSVYIVQNGVCVALDRQRVFPSQLTGTPVRV